MNDIERMAAHFAWFIEQGRNRQREVNPQGGSSAHVRMPTEEDLHAILEERPPYFHRLLEYAEHAFPNDTFHKFAGAMDSMQKDVSRGLNAIENLFGPSRPLKTRAQRRGGK
jgi:hypothetical protein